MGILCGVDIIEIDRVKQSLESCDPGFRDKVFTQNEINYCEDRKAARFESYAARFAAKEAVSKALGTGIGRGISWKDIEVLNDEHGRPYVALWGRARDIYEELHSISIALSLSHCRSHAAAYTVIETEGKGR